VLSPHNIIFTAYLKQTGYAEWELGIFRGIGALMGVIATFVFPWVAAKFGMRAVVYLNYRFFDKILYHSNQ